MKSKDKKGLYLAIASIFAIVVIIRVSYAYLPTDDLANEPQDAQASTATLKLKYTDCASDVQSDCADITADLKPGESVTKTFEVKNVGTKAVKYDIYFRELENSFKNGDLVYTLEDMATGESLIVRTEVPEGTNTNVLIKSQITSPVGSTARYRLTVKFLDRNYEQSDNYDATFNMKLKIVEANNGPAENTLAHLKITPKASIPNFEEPAKTDEGVFAMEDDYGMSYYYRGAVENNYVKFADFYWRIIRVNGDGSLRMIYDGTSAHANGESNTDRITHTDQKYNEKYYDAKYVGWMYGPADTEDGAVLSTSKAQAQTNIADSDIKKVVDTWYKTNIVDKGYSSAVSDTLFCNDRSTPGKSVTGWDGDTGLGYRQKATAFGPIARYGWSGTAGYNNPRPQFKCPQKNDAFTMSDTTKGNGALTYPVGLITADEIVAAGSGKYTTPNSDYYLYKGSMYWSLSPGHMSPNAEVSMFYADRNGELISYYVYISSVAVAPVINLSAEYVATLSGTGTMTDPYTAIE